MADTEEYKVCRNLSKQTPTFIIMDGQMDKCPHSHCTMHVEEVLKDYAKRVLWEKNYFSRGRLNFKPLIEHSLY